MVCIHGSACSSYSCVAHGAEVDNLMNTWILIFIVQAITQVYYIFAFKYRGENKALYFADNNKLEALWSVIPIILAGLILYTVFMLGRISCLSTRG
jgi:cytochrome c oxidase subunit 2